LLAIAAFSLTACSSEPESSTACRGDETRVDDTCVPWQDAPLSVDFDVEVDGTTVTCVVQPGGFPRDRVEALRFSFGDGAAGYGETISHQYGVAGVYPIDLTVRLQGYRMLRASRLVVIGAPSSQLVLTLDQIPDYLNGTLPFTSDNGTSDPSDDYDSDFHLLVPDAGFSVDISLLAGSGLELDGSTLQISADRAIGDGAIPAGTNLADKVSFERGEVDRVPRGVWTVAAADRFPAGMITLTASARDAGGTDHTQSITFEVTQLTTEIDPFDRPMVWLFRFDMDLYTVVPNPATSGVSASPGADGLPDFAQELAAIGAQGSESAAGAATVRGRGVVGANAIYERWVIAEIITEVRRYYGIAPDGTPRDGITMDIYATGDPGAPDPASFDVDGAFSMMRFGGSLANNFGRSRFSIHNQGRVDDTSADLGVGTSRIIDPLISIPVVADQFFVIHPEATNGVRVGEHPLDATVLADEFDRYDPANSPEANQRYDDLALIARQLGMAIAAVTAHEMGHAMGLVPNGPPPFGYFGGRGDVSFINPEHTDSHHVDFPFLNLMQAGGNPLLILDDALDTIETPADYNLADMLHLLAVENRLSPYARAYFRRQLTYSAFEGPTP
jgi:hypothetical protein